MDPSCIFVSVWYEAAQAERAVSPGDIRDGHTFFFFFYVSTTETFRLHETIQVKLMLLYKIISYLGCTYLYNGIFQI